MRSDAERYTEAAEFMCEDAVGRLERLAADEEDPKVRQALLGAADGLKDAAGFLAEAHRVAHISRISS